jgi:hypothetical protein
VLKNFTNKPIEKRKGIAVVHNLEPPPFVPPALPDRAHSGGTRMGTAGEGKTESMLQAVDDDDDNFMANLDIDRSPLPAPMKPVFPCCPTCRPAREIINILSREDTAGTTAWWQMRGHRAKEVRGEVLLRPLPAARLCLGMLKRLVNVKRWRKSNANMLASMRRE